MRVRLLHLSGWGLRVCGLLEKRQEVGELLLKLCDVRLSTSSSSRDCLDGLGKLLLRVLLVGH